MCSHEAQSFYGVVHAYLPIFKKSASGFDVPVFCMAAAFFRPNKWQALYFRQLTVVADRKLGLYQDCSRTCAPFLRTIGGAHIASIRSCMGSGCAGCHPCSRAYLAVNHMPAQVQHLLIFRDMFCRYVDTRQEKQPRKTKPCLPVCRTRPTF